MTVERIDWPAVRRARGRLDALAETHPELTGPRGPENVAAWEAVLEREEAVDMPRVTGKTVQVAARLESELVGPLDAAVVRLAEATGIRVVRSDVIRLALRRYLVAEGLVAAPEAPRKARR